MVVFQKWDLSLVEATKSGLVVRGDEIWLVDVETNLPNPRRSFTLSFSSHPKFSSSNNRTFNERKTEVPTSANSLIPPLSAQMRHEPNFIPHLHLKVLSYCNLPNRTEAHLSIGLQAALGVHW
ncbi:hypothetical protein JAAARDRAFT_487244 [Jaapia argillacea MUCL 33604]|uniref:Uncharacterized protein n=1 Tax=Jaapia argillacea MUCL 33604 TaxID=933084 RepID=A0A067PBX1_9AGAM|nr:hypothetical protein JAAARDRAFT_487244 [Jaapia argillacea MUCL 33604]